jgi:hypothetical protein
MLVILLGSYLFAGAKLAFFCLLSAVFNGHNRALVWRKTGKRNFVSDEV